jgi:hypothetical protein
MSELRYKNKVAQNKIYSLRRSGNRNLCTLDLETHDPSIQRVQEVGRSDRRSVDRFKTFYINFTQRWSVQFSSNKSPTRCNNFPVYYPDVYLQLNMFPVYSRPSSGAQWLQWQPLVLPSYRGDSRAVFVVGPDHEHSTTVTTILTYLLHGAESFLRS